MNILGIHLRLIGVAASWGATWSWAREIVKTVPPVTGAALRFLLAGAALLAWVFAVDRFRSIRALDGRQWLGLTACAAVGVFLYTVLFMSGMQYIPAGKGAVIITLNPAITLLVAAWLFGEKLNPVIGLGMVLSLSGAMVAVSHGDISLLWRGGVGAGEALILGAALCWSSYTLLSRVVMKGIPPLTATAVSAVIGGLALVPAGLVVDGVAGWQAVAGASAYTWYNMLALAFVGTVLAYAWYFGGVKALGAGNAAAYIVLVPIFGIGLAAWWLGETVDASLLLGVVLAVVGLALINVGQRRGR